MVAAAGVLKKKKRNDLTLAQKYTVIQASKKFPKPGIRKLAEEFQCGKTQISTILQNEARIVEMYEENASGAACQLKRVRNSKFGELNDSLFQWYCMATSRNLFPDGPILMEKAKEISHRLGHPEGSFKASNGWLEAWKKRYNIKQVAVSGESGDVSGDTVSSWREGFQRSSLVILQVIYGTLMKQAVFDVHYLRKALEEKVRSVRVGKNQSTGQRLPSSSMEQVKVNACPL